MKIALRACLCIKHLLTSVAVCIFAIYQTDHVLNEVGILLLQVKLFTLLLHKCIVYCGNAVSWQVACMQFINIIVHSVEDVNFRVHLQHEFSLLGLDKCLEVRILLYTLYSRLHGYHFQVYCTCSICLNNKFTYI